MLTNNSPVLGTICYTLPWQNGSMNMLLSITASDTLLLLAPNITCGCRRHLVLGWLHVYQQLSWFGQKQFGHSLAVSNGVEEEEVAPAMLLHVDIITDP